MSALMIDNWLLQDVGRCLVDGLSADTSSEISVDHTRDTHVVKDVSGAGVQVEALLGVLSDLVLRDAILVDQKFTNTWAPKSATFNAATRQGLLRPVDFLARGDALKGPRQFMVDALCVTSSLRDVQLQNERSWKMGRGPKNPYMSQVVWGTAGMLSRSHVFEVPYQGHPLRRRLLEQAFGQSYRRDAVKEVVDWIAAKRLRLYEGQSGNGTVRQSAIALPNVAIDVINEAASVEQLVPVAMQLREKYRKMREWLKTVQEAMDTDDPKALLKFRRILAAVERDVDRALGKGQDQSVSITLGVSGFDVNFEVLTLDNVLKKFGIRAMLNNQIFHSRGNIALTKLMKMFGEGKTSSGLRCLEYLRIQRVPTI